VTRQVTVSLCGAASVLAGLCARRLITPIVLGELAGFVIGAPVGALTLAPVVSRNGGRVLLCKEIEDGPYPRPSHRTKPSPRAVLSLHDLNDITGRDRAAYNDHRHDRALHCRGSITRERHSAPQA